MTCIAHILKIDRILKKEIKYKLKLLIFAKLAINYLTKETFKIKLSNKMNLF